VRWRADGTLEYLGRLDQQVKLRGFRVEPDEIAAVLRQQPGVADALVLLREDWPGEPRLVAYVVMGDGCQGMGNGKPTSGDSDATSNPQHPTPNTQQLRTALAERLPDYMVPTDYVLLEAWPQTPSGKIDRAALPAPERTRAAAGTAYVAPTTPREAELAELCGALLGVAQVGVTDSFFALGGHSLLATQLLARVRAQYGVEVPLRALFEQPTVAGLAVAIEHALASTPEVAQAPALTAIARDTRRMKRSALTGNGHTSAQPAEPQTSVKDDV
jgi:acyl carrier protein